MSAGRFLLPAERDQLLACLPSPRDRLLVTLGLHTGLRVSELLQLQVSQVWRNGQPVEWLEVARRTLKGGRGANAQRLRGRRIPLHEKAATALQEYIHGCYELVPPEPHAFTALLTR